MFPARHSPVRFFPARYFPPDGSGSPLSTPETIPTAYLRLGYADALSVVLSMLEIPLFLSYLASAELELSYATEERLELSPPQPLAVSLSYEAEKTVTLSLEG